MISNHGLEAFELLKAQPGRQGIDHAAGYETAARRLWERLRARLEVRLET